MRFSPTFSKDRITSSISSATAKLVSAESVKYTVFNVKNMSYVNVLKKRGLRTGFYGTPDKMSSHKLKRKPTLGLYLRFDKQSWSKFKEDALRLEAYSFAIKKSWSRESHIFDIYLRNTPNALFLWVASLKKSASLMSSFECHTLFWKPL